MKKKVILGIVDTCPVGEGEGVSGGDRMKLSCKKRRFVFVELGAGKHFRGIEITRIVFKLVSCKSLVSEPNQGESVFQPTRVSGYSFFGKRNTIWFTN